jgi:hypothetical protein
MGAGFSYFQSKRSFKDSSAGSSAKDEEGECG